jgi:hypothetical protein
MNPSGRLTMKGFAAAVTAGVGKEDNKLLNPIGEQRSEER